MASPQPTATTTTTAQRTAPPRTGAMFGIVGAALAIVGFFLPWTLQVDVAHLSSGNPPTFSVVSGWDLATKWLNGPALVSGGPATGHATTPFYSLALMTALPTLLAVVALVVCVLALFRRPGPVLNGLFASAALVGILSALGENPMQYVTTVVGIAPTPDSASWMGIGVALQYLGYFGIFAGGVITALSARQARSQG